MTIGLLDIFSSWTFSLELDCNYKIGGGGILSVCRISSLSSSLSENLAGAVLGLTIFLGSIFGCCFETRCLFSTYNIDLLSSALS
jgi:hypothetical protein